MQGTCTAFHRSLADSVPVRVPFSLASDGPSCASCAPCFSRCYRARWVSVPSILCDEIGREALLRAVASVWDTSGELAAWLQLTTLPIQNGLKKPKSYENVFLSFFVREKCGVGEQLPERPPGPDDSGNQRIFSRPFSYSFFFFGAISEVLRRKPLKNCS